MEANEARFEALLETMVAEGVFTETGDGHLRWSDELVKTRGTKLEFLEGENEYERVHEQFVGSTPKQEESMETPRILASALAIREIAPATREDEAILLAETFARFEGKQPTEGVPDGFIPITAQEIESFLDEMPSSILYFWREDCPPCRTMKTRLEHLLETGAIPDKIGTASVYGPDDVAHIREQYQVGIAPTILFTRDGRVDTRHIGETYKEVIREEIAIITGRSEEA